MDKRMIKIKFCGITNVEDALYASALGVDAIGFIFTKSKRMISPETAKNIIKKMPLSLLKVGVFMNDPLDTVVEITEYTDIDIIQLHGDESPEYCNRIKNITKKKIIKRIDVSNQTFGSLEKKTKRYRAFFPLFDPGAGEGKTFDTDILRSIKFPYILAGGLNPSNVSEIIKDLTPYAVDVSSGIEKEIGKKNHKKMKNFVKEVKKC